MCFINNILRKNYELNNKSYITTHKTCSILCLREIMSDNVLHVPPNNSPLLFLYIIPIKILTIAIFIISSLDISMQKFKFTKGDKVSGEHN